MLEAIGAGISPRVGPKDWKDVWRDSPECKAAQEEIRIMKEEALAKPVETKKDLTKTCGSSYSPANHPWNIHQTFLVFTDAAPFLYQLAEVTKRSLTALWRNPDYIWTRLFVHAFIALFVSLSLLDLKNSLRDLQSRVFGMCGWLSFSFIVNNLVADVFIVSSLLLCLPSSCSKVCRFIPRVWKSHSQICS